MSYPPETSRSCHEADGRSDRSGGSGGATSSSGGGVYGTLCSNLGGKWSTQAPAAEQLNSDQSGHQITINTTASQHDRLVSNWKKWSLGLDYLLQDSEGVALFKTYLQYEGCSNLLDFWFACQGFRSKVDPADHRKIAQLIKVIYRTYIRGSGTGTVGMSNVSLPGKTTLVESHTNPNVLQVRSEPIRLRAETKRMISERISRKHSLDQSVFDPAQTEVEHFLRTTAYPAFLKSDIYIDFLQSAIDGSTYKFQPVQDTGSRAGSIPWPAIGGAGQSTSGFSGGILSHTLGGKFLPTLEEDRELRSDDLPCYPARPSRTQAGQINNNSGPTPGQCVAQHVQQLHCLHCSQYHSQGHPVCSPGGDQINPWQAQVPHPLPVGMRPPLASMSNTGNLQATSAITTSAAPLTTENIQMTRFYRAELSLQQQQQQQLLHNPMTGLNVMRMVPQVTDPLGRRPYPHGLCDLTTGVARPSAYVHTHWMDALCPTSVPPAELRGSTRLPSQPPNPYHISYAPVSARDSERHSLSSEARTDDTHSHTDSSHDGATTRLWQFSFGHRHPGQLPKHSIAQALSMPPTSADVLTSTDTSSLSYNRFNHPSTAFTEHSLGSGTSPAALLSPKPGDDFTHGTRPHRYTTTTTGNAFHSPETSGEPIKSHGKHQRRAMRRSGWRSGDRGRCTTGTGNASGVSGDLLIAATAGAASKSTNRSHNLAERDPQAFFRILSDKLQRVLENQLATERLDLLMTEGSPSADQSASEVLNLSETLHSSVPYSQPPSSSLSEVGGQTTTTVSITTTAEITKPRSAVTASSLLQRPWADRLLAAARVQHESTRDNAQAILEDHCSRIWAASADRTPNSSSSGGGNCDRDPEDSFARVSQPTATHMLTGRSMSIEPAFGLPGNRDSQRTLASPHHTGPQSDGVRGVDRNQFDEVCEPVVPTDATIPSSERTASTLSGTQPDVNTDFVSKTKHAAGTSPDSLVSASSSSSSSSGEQRLGRASTMAQLNALLNLSFIPSDHVSNPGPSTTTVSSTTSQPLLVHSPNDANIAHPPRPPPTTTVSTTQHSTSSSITSAISTSTPGLQASSPSSNSPTTLVIGYYLGDDPVPYRSLWPSSEITLGQFKQLIPKKKGSFRYFFKKLSNEFGSGVVHQEITNDSCLLPLWEGKVVAKVERIE